MPNNLGTKDPFSSGTGLYVDATNGSDTTGRGTQAMPYKTIQKAVNEIPPVTVGYATISIAAGTYPEDVNITQRNGCPIHLYATGGKVTVNSFHIVLAHVLFSNMNLEIAAEGNEHGIYVNRGTVEVSGANSALKINGKQTAVSAGFGGNFYLAGAVTFVGCNYCMYVNRGRMHVVATVTGEGNGVAYYATGGLIQLASVVNPGATSLYASTHGGRTYTGAQTSAPNS
jgi:hypothetical protein